MPNAAWLAALAVLLALVPPAHAQAPQPDLGVTALGPEPSAPGDGDVMRFSATVRSSGADSGGFNVSFEVDATVIGRAHVASLPADHTATVVSPAWPATQGNHSLRAVADADHQVEETDESNNDLTRSFTVGAHVQRPELAVTGIAFSPAHPQPGASVTITVNITNGGDADAGPFNATLTVDGTGSFDPFVVGGLHAGVTLTPSRGPWTASQGRHVFRVQVDTEQQVQEHDEWNDDRNFTLDVGGAQPDLAIADLALQPANPGVGGTATLTAHVKNQGGAGVGAFLVAFFDGSTSLGTASVSGLAAGQLSPEVSMTWRASAGTHSLRVAADSAAQVAESDEGNNARTLQVTPGQGAPDLQVVSLASEPANPRVGDAATFTATVQNAGPGPAGAFDVQFAMDGRGLGTSHVAGLAAGQAATLRSNAWGALQGTHTVTVRADSGHALAEVGEDNNQASFVVSIGPREALALRVTGLAAQPAPPMPNDTVVFVASIEASGVPAGQQLVVAFALDGDSLGTQTVTARGDGPLTVTSAPWTARAGLHTASAGVGGPGVEENTQDNVAVLHLTVGNLTDEAPTSSTGALADLVAVAVAPADAQPVAGTSVPVTAEVRNAGQGAAGPFSVVVLVDGQRIGSQDVPGLAAGADANLTFTGWQATPGAHTFQAVVDPVDAVHESDEGNNAVQSQPAPAHPKPIPGAEPAPLLALLALAALRRSPR